MASTQRWQEQVQAGSEEVDGKRFDFGFLISPEEAPPCPAPPSRDDIIEPPVPVLAGRFGITRTEG